MAFQKTLTSLIAATLLSAPVYATTPKNERSLSATPLPEYGAPESSMDKYLPGDTITTSPELSYDNNIDPILERVERSASSLTPLQKEAAGLIRKAEGLFSSYAQNFANETDTKKVDSAVKLYISAWEKLGNTCPSSASSLASIESIPLHNQLGVLINHRLIEGSMHTDIGNAFQSPSPAPSTSRIPSNLENSCGFFRDQAKACWPKYEMICVDKP